MIELSMIEAAVFQLRAAMASLQDEFALTQMKLSLGEFERALAEAKSGLNAARVNDLSFAMNDFVAAVDQLSAADAAVLEPSVELLKRDLAALQQATALPQSLLESMKAFQRKLRARRAAIERQAMSGETAELPHPPSELAADARSIKEQLNTAGFSTAALDAFLEDPESLRFHAINEMFDELEVITG
ncbi:MAG TPA: hypothetical protein VFL80_03050 [Thermoanaerobaculia bacterium]|nr:hypothetical protein [Thermoanaerobaculia bacterium]